MSEPGMGNMPHLIPQKNGGALLSGGVPGHKGGSGRPSSELRDRLRGTIEQRVAILAELLDNPKTSAADKIRCVDVMLRYGLGVKDEIEHSFGGLIEVLTKLPEEMVKKLEAMTAEQIQQSLSFMLGDGRREAAEQVTAKINALIAAREREAEQAVRPPKLPRPRPLDPKREVKPAHDPGAVIMTFYDGGLPKARQEPPESVEAVAEPEAVPEAEKAAQRSSWPQPGRAVVTRESLCDRLF